MLTINRKLIDDNIDRIITMNNSREKQFNFLAKTNKQMYKLLNNEKKLIIICSTHNRKKYVNHKIIAIFKHNNTNKNNYLI
jgi:hypothetical protein